jgi:hypothetical protein
MGELTLEWCSTTQMVGDFMTKPLQGASFRKFRDIIMGAVPSADTTTPRNKSLGLVPQERGPHRSVLDIRKERSHKSSPS